MSEEIVLVARLKVKEDCIESAKEAAFAIVEDSRAEAGCINYDIHQAIDDPTVLIWHETWKSKRALDEHFETPFFKEFFVIAGEVAAEPPSITIARMITAK